MLELKTTQVKWIFGTCVLYDPTCFGRLTAFKSEDSVSCLFYFQTCRDGLFICTRSKQDMGDFLFGVDFLIFRITLLKLLSLLWCSPGRAQAIEYARRAREAKNHWFAGNDSSLIEWYIPYLLLELYCRKQFVNCIFLYCVKC